MQTLQDWDWGPVSHHTHSCSGGLVGWVPVWGDMGMPKQTGMRQSPELALLLQAHCRVCPWGLQLLHALQSSESGRVGPGGCQQMLQLQVHCGQQRGTVQSGWEQLPQLFGRAGPIALHP